MISEMGHIAVAIRGTTKTFLLEGDTETTHRLGHDAEAMNRPHRHLFAVLADTLRASDVHRGGRELAESITSVSPITRSRSGLGSYTGTQEALRAMGTVMACVRRCAKAVCLWRFWMPILQDGKGVPAQRSS